MAEDVTGASSKDADIAKLLGLGTEDNNTEEPEAEQDAEQEDVDTDEDQESEDEKPTEFADLPKSWQDKIKDLRRESGDRRSKIRTLEAELKDSRAGKAQTPEAELEAAKQAGHDAARAEYGTKLAGAEVKAALKGVIADDRLGKVVETLNLARFVDEDGGVDTDLITDLRDEYVSLLGTRKSIPRASHGRTGSGASKKKSAADLFGEALNI